MSGSLNKPLLSVEHLSVVGVEVVGGDGAALAEGGAAVGMGIRGGNEGDAGRALVGAGVREREELPAGGGVQLILDGGRDSSAADDGRPIHARCHSGDGC